MLSFLFLSKYYLAESWVQNTFQFLFPFPQMESFTGSGRSHNNAVVLYHLQLFKKASGEKKEGWTNMHIRKRTSPKRKSQSSWKHLPINGCACNLATEQKSENRNKKRTIEWVGATSATESLFIFILLLFFLCCLSLLFLALLKLIANP